MASGLVTNLTKRAHVGHGFGESRHMTAEPPTHCPACRLELVVTLDGNVRECPRHRICHYIWVRMPEFGLTERHRVLAEAEA